jgi:hypothetical protein
VAGPVQYVYSDAYQAGFRGDAPVWADVSELDAMRAGLDVRADDALEAADGDAMIRSAAPAPGAEGWMRVSAACARAQRVLPGRQDSIARA